MVRLDYKLTQEEAVRYYEMILNHAKETRVPRIFAIIWLPFVLVALMIALKLTRNLTYWIVFVFLSLVWIIFLAPRLFGSITREAAKRRVKQDNFKLERIAVVDKDGTFTVNGVEKQPVNFVTYLDLFILAFEDQSNLIIPDRVFDKDEKKMEQFAKDVLLSVKEYSEKKSA